MAEIVLLAFLVLTAFLIFGAILYSSTRRGEDCSGYPYNCPYCRHAARCIIEIGRKDKK